MRSSSILPLVLGALSACAVETAAEPDRHERGPIGKADAAGQCAPSDCGGPASQGVCWCDESCSFYGDCCSNYGGTCEPQVACQPEDCGEKPLFVHCADGVSIAAPDVCTTLEDGACGWTATCALPEGEVECEPTDCGEKPLFVHCADGVSIAAPDVCTTLEDGTCGWTAQCALPTEPCTPEACGPAPDFAPCVENDGLLGIADSCVTTATGCEWVASC